MILDNTEITIHCPKCKREIRERIGRLKNNPGIPCPGCGVFIAVDGSQLASAQKAMEKELGDIRSAIKRINTR